MDEHAEFEGLPVLELFECEALGAVFFGDGSLGVWGLFHYGISIKVLMPRLF